MTVNHKLILNEVRDYMFIALGLAIYTVAFTVFLMPYQIVAGGVTGLSADTKNHIIIIKVLGG